MSDPRECPFCRRAAPRAEHLDPEVLLLVLANNPWWRPEAGLCAPCPGAFAEAFGGVMSGFLVIVTVARAFFYLMGRRHG